MTDLQLALRRTTSRDAAFVELTRRLDREVSERLGDAIRGEVESDTAIVAVAADVPVACGCFCRFDTTTAELRRIFVVSERRWHGIGRKLVYELEAWARDLAFATMVAETNLRQPEAMELYESCGYAVVDNFGPYADVPGSVCFKKPLVR